MSHSFLTILITVSAMTLSSPLVMAFGGKSSPSSSGDSASSSSNAEATVWVSRSDGSQMCSTDTGKSLEQGSNELTSAHIRVVSSQKGSDTKMHAQMCGLPTGHVNAYEINKSDLAKASVLGYQQIK